MNKTKNIDLRFYEQKWFKLVCLLSFFGVLFYIFHDPSEINEEELNELYVTVDKGWESGGSKNPYKVYFKTKEYSNRFGIRVGGVFGRWTEVTNTLKENRKVRIKINKEDKLNSDEIVPIYYLSNSNSDIVFTTKDFNEGKSNSNQRVMVFLFVLFLLGLWKVLG